MLLRSLNKSYLRVTAPNPTEAERNTIDSREQDWQLPISHLVNTGLGVDLRLPHENGVAAAAGMLTTMLAC